MQSYKDIQATDIIRDSREVINDNIKTAISNNSGEEFPTDNLIAGMKCYRTDEGKTYTYNGTEWVADDSKADNATHATTADTCTGNSATATTLETKRNISLTGAATGTATAFNGGSDIAIPVTSLDASKLTGTASVSTTGNSATTTKLATARTLTITDGTNSGTATSFDGSANVSIKLPSTIKASLSGNATSATTAGTCTGNAATATKATLPAGFATVDSGAWGNTTGTHLTGWQSTNGGSVDFRESSGTVNMKIDGVFYQREGAKVVIDESTVNNYAPTKTGSGASGTWGINITGSSASCTGNATTATKATTATTASAVAWTGVTGKPTLAKVSSWNSSTGALALTST